MLRARAERLLAQLEPGESPTLDELADRLGWSEEATASGLAVAVQRGELIEELDVERGAWTYRASPAAAVPEPLTTESPALRSAMERLQSHRPPSDQPWHALVAAETNYSGD